MGFIAKIRNHIAIRRTALQKRMVLRLLVGSGRKPEGAGNSLALNRTQRLFVQWNAERLGISEEESLQRYLYSWQTVPGGHRGFRFDLFMYLNQEIFSVFYGNGDDELFETYKFHGHRDLLRQMIFTEPVFTGDHPIVRGFSDLAEIVILDFGCGLAQRSRFLAEFLQSQGKQVKIHLADIYSVEADFLEWIGRNSDLDITFHACTRENPIPPLPDCHVLVATEFFEHVSNPLDYFRRFDAVLQDGGFLWTDVADHEEGFLHVCPILGDLRQEMEKQGYRDLEPHVLFQKKPVQDVVATP